MTFSKVLKQKVTGHVIDQLMSAITSGQFGPGDRLPTEFALADAMEVGRSTIREALQGMEILGIIRRKKSGSFVSEDFNFDLLTKFLYTKLLVGNLDLSEIYQARRILEGELSVLAIGNLSPEDLIALRELCERMQGIPLDKSQDYLNLNQDFHKRICSIAGNAVLMQMWELTDRLLRETLEPQTITPELRNLSNLQHLELLDALEAGKAAELRAVIEKSLRRMETSLERSSADRHHQEHALQPLPEDNHSP